MAVANSRLLTFNQVCTLFGVSRDWLWRHSFTVKENERIPSYKVGKLRKYKFDELNYWLENRREWLLLAGEHADSPATSNTASEHLNKTSWLNASQQLRSGLTLGSANSPWQIACSGSTCWILVITPAFGRSIGLLCSSTSLDSSTAVSTMENGLWRFPMRNGSSQSSSTSNTDSFQKPVNHICT